MIVLSLPKSKRKSTGSFYFCQYEEKNKIAENIDSEELIALKFTDGFWVVKKGVRLHPAVQVRDMEITDKSVTLYAAPFRVENRGQTLGGPLLTLRITSPLPDILRVEAWHFAGSAKKEPSFELNGGLLPLRTEEKDGGVSITSGGLTAEVSKDTFSIRYSYNGRLLTVSYTHLTLPTIYSV